MFSLDHIFLTSTVWWYHGIAQAQAQGITETGSYTEAASTAGAAWPLIKTATLLTAPLASYWIFVYGSMTRSILFVLGMDSAVTITM